MLARRVTANTAHVQGRSRADRCAPLAHARHTSCVRADARARVCRRCAGFTLIEVVVVLGVLTVLIGLFLPAVAGSWERAQLVADGAHVRQTFGLVTLYANDHDDHYPVGHANAQLAAMRWYRPILAGGYAESEADIDPCCWDRPWGIGITLSVCMVYEPRYMRFGWTQPVDEQASVPVAQHQVTYPSLKGVMVRAMEGYYARQGGRAFCCTDRWTAPIAFGDGSIEFGDYISFNFGEPPITENAIGWPVMSTWGGYLARDR